MTYRYVLKMDQKRAQYDKWTYRNLDLIVTVDANDFEEAYEEAKRLCPPLPARHEWACFAQSITKVDEPQEHVHSAACDKTTPTTLQRVWTKQGFRYRGV